MNLYTVRAHDKIFNIRWPSEIGLKRFLSKYHGQSKTITLFDFNGKLLGKRSYGIWEKQVLTVVWNRLYWSPARSQWGTLPRTSGKWLTFWLSFNHKHCPFDLTLGQLRVRGFCLGDLGRLYAMIQGRVKTDAISKIIASGLETKNGLYGRTSKPPWLKSYPRAAKGVNVSMLTNRKVEGVTK